MSKEQQSLYDVSYSEIFFKNFLIGFARGLGALATQLLLFAIIGTILYNFIWPKIEPLVNAYTSAQQFVGRSREVPDLFGNFFNGSQDIQLDTPKQTK